MIVPTWPLIIGCAVAGVAVVARRRTTGILLLVAALSLAATPYAPALGASAILVSIPLALVNVVAARWKAVDAAIAVTGLGAAVSPATAAVGLGLTTVVLLAVAVGLRFEQTAGDDRRRVLWVILGLVLPLPSLLVLLSPAAEHLALVVGLMAAALPLSAGVAVLAPTIVDVRAVVERLTVAVVMIALTTAAYIGAEAAVAVATGSAPAMGVRVLLVLAVAAAFHPVLRWVRTSVDEMLFGGRTDPVRTLTLLGGRLAEGASPPDWLDTLRLALAAPGVAIRNGGEIIAASGNLDGSPTAHSVLRTGTADVGELVVALSNDDPRLARATQAVLGLVSVPLAQALHAAALTEELRESRGRAVTALEEERRRLRRDLHDGLGPMLTGITYSADAVANLLHADPAEASAVTESLRTQARDAIAEIRRIVYGLRPKALDELGLLGAVQQQAARLRTPDGRFLAVEFDVSGDLVGLAAATEVAAYRVAVEALTNSARHSGTAAASVGFAVHEGRLVLTVRDRGRTAEAWTPGVGIASMRERAEQVGGSLRIKSDVDGTVVTADLPLTR